MTDEWEYVDESGIVLFVKQRFKTSDTKGKTYKLLRVMEDGSRQASMQGARVIPYRLSDVLEAKLQANTPRAIIFHRAVRSASQPKSGEANI